MSLIDRKSALTLLLATIAALCAPWSSYADDPDEFFVKQALPILEKRCLSCHSHAAGKAKGGLVLDSKSGWLAWITSD